MNLAQSYAKKFIKNCTLSGSKKWCRFNNRMNQKAFTLIELLIVMAIVSFLASVFLPTLQEARAKGEDARRVGSLKSLQAEVMSQTNAGSTPFTNIFTSGAAATKLTKLITDAGLAPGTYSSYSDATSFALVVPMKTDPSRYWCIDADGNSKQVPGLLLNTAGPKSCNNATGPVLSLGGSATMPFSTPDTTPDIIVSTNIGDVVTIPGYICSPSPAISTTVTCTTTNAYSAGTQIITITSTFTGGTQVSNVSFTVGGAISGPSVISTITTGSGSHFSVAAGSKVYVSNYNANTVSVINTATDTLIATIPVGSHPYALTAVGSYVYVPNSGSNTVSVINTATDTVSTTITTVGFMPIWAVAVGTKLYVSDTSGLTVINTTTNTYDSWIYASSSGSLTVVGAKIYIPETDPFNPGVHILDTTSGIITNFITLPSVPKSATLSGTKLFINLNLTNQVAVINTSTETLSTTIPVGTSPAYSVVVGNALYVNNQNGGTVSVINVTTNGVISTISVGSNTQYSTTLSSKVYTNNNSSGTVSVIDTLSNTVTSTVTVGSGPSYSTAVGTKLYVSNYGSGTVSVIQTN